MMGAPSSRRAVVNTCICIVVAGAYFVVDATAVVTNMSKVSILIYTYIDNIIDFNLLRS